MTQHTPGPWELHGDLLCGGQYVPLNQKSPPSQFEIANLICKADNGFYPWQPDYETSLANGRLICAAPELLAACEQFVKHIGEMRQQWKKDGSEHDTKLHGLSVSLNNRPGDLLLAAIARATGKAVAE